MRKKPKNRNRHAGAEVPQVPGPTPTDVVTELFDIPHSSLGSIPQIELAGNREAVVDGCTGILEYDENIIKLACPKMSIQFLGRDLQIKVLTRDSAIVTGFIHSVEFIL